MLSYSQPHQQVGLSAARLTGIQRLIRQRLRQLERQKQRTLISPSEYVDQKAALDEKLAALRVRIQELGPADPSEASAE